MVKMFIESLFRLNIPMESAITRICDFSSLRLRNSVNSIRNNAYRVKISI